MAPASSAPASLRIENAGRPWRSTNSTAAATIRSRVRVPAGFRPAVRPAGPRRSSSSDGGLTAAPRLAEDSSMSTAYATPYANDGQADHGGRSAPTCRISRRSDAVRSPAGRLAGRRLLRTVAVAGRRLLPLAVPVARGTLTPAKAGTAIAAGCQ